TGVDTVVGYSSMGNMPFLAGCPNKFNQWSQADNSVIQRANDDMATPERETARPPDVPRTATMPGVALGVSSTIRKFSETLPRTPVLSAGPSTILLVSAVGIILSFTPIRMLENYGASKVGYAGIYLLLASIGAKADLAYVLDAPQYVLLGLVWLAIHVITIFIFARLLRAPLFFVAVGSQGNIGGSSSAPVVASVFQPALAPVGLLMGILGNVVGTYAAVGAAALAEWVSSFYF